MTENKQHETNGLCLNDQYVERLKGKISVPKNGMPGDEELAHYVSKLELNITKEWKGIQCHC